MTAPMRSVETPIDLDLGIVLCTVSGLMNLVLMCDAYTVAERSVFPVKGRAASVVAQSVGNDQAVSSKEAST